jgi:hypothetical protein
MKMKFNWKCLMGILFTIQSCGKNCEGWAEEFRLLEYQFKIEKKDDSGRNIIISGTNQKGENETFRWTGFNDVYSAAGIGDTLIKIKGELRVQIAKTDTLLQFTYDCRGRVIN